ncbi:hypothetical protein V3C99_005921 [Haemonchus contortus]|uniref:Protein kinase domain-containing protein n=1 Tax=Haemonchus contortus TaxID=6289 RepID=A0A7I4XU14_HAECO|nr:Serine threonine protein kinase-related domain containing protein [Haemonchus contortus]
MPKDDPLNDMPKASEDIIKSKKGTYEVLEILGKGSFGAVFRVRRLEDNKELAMKCESYKVKKQILRHEARVLEGLRRISSVHFISYEDRGKISGRFMFVVLRLVGKNLWDLRMESVDRRFSMSTAIRAAEQTLSGIRDVHICGFLHRDIKPPNFAIGREEDNLQQTIYILDFGLCRRYRTDEKDLRYMREKAAFRGTTRYASISALEMKDQCRRDDVEAWWYMVLEWMTGQLPWRHCRGADRAEVKMFKQQLRVESNLKKVLKHTPSEYMANILLYIDTLEYNSIPDYDHIAANLEAAMEAYHLSYSEPLDWDAMTEYKGPRYIKNLDYELKG